MGEEGELDAMAPTETQGLLPLLCAASIQGRSALGSEPGARVQRLGIPEASLAGRALVITELCAELDALKRTTAGRPPPTVAGERWQPTSLWTGPQPEEPLTSNPQLMLTSFRLPQFFPIGTPADS